MTDDPLASLVSLEGVASAYAATRDGIDALLRDRGLRQASTEQIAASLLRGAEASDALEGTSGVAVRVSGELLSLVPTIKTAPLQALARLHVLAGTGSVAAEELGRPVSPAAAAGLQSLSRLMLSPTTAPALVVAAVVHADLRTIAPFASHNGIVARAAERLLLVARGVDPTSLTVPEAGHLRLRAEYDSNLRGWASGGLAGRHAWLLYAAEAYAAGAEASPLRSA